MPKWFYFVFVFCFCLSWSCFGSLNFWTPSIWGLVWCGTGENVPSSLFQVRLLFLFLFPFWYSHGTCIFCSCLTVLGYTVGLFWSLFLFPPPFCKKLKYIWFTMCQFLLYRKVTQSYIYIHIPLLSCSITRDWIRFLCYAVGFVLFALQCSG